MSLETSASCPQHPESAAHFVCARCQTAVCGDCCYTMPDGTVCCKSCYGSETTLETPATSTPPPLRLAPYQAIPKPAVRIVPVSPGQKGCVQHPAVMPVAYCYNCGAGSCRTCDFVFPVNLHYCPVCVTAAAGQLSPRRRKYMVVAFILAAFASLGLVLFFGGAIAGMMADNPAAETILGLALLLLVGSPSIVGTGLGMSAKRPGGPNPISIWLALVWNALLLGGLVLLIVIGNFMD